MDDFAIMKDGAFQFDLNFIERFREVFSISTHQDLLSNAWTDDHRSSLMIPAFTELVHSLITANTHIVLYAFLAKLRSDLGVLPLACIGRRQAHLAEDRFVYLVRRQDIGVETKWLYHDRSSSVYVNSSVFECYDYICSDKDEPIIGCGCYGGGMLVNPIEVRCDRFSCLSPEMVSNNSPHGRSLSILSLICECHSDGMPKEQLIMEQRFLSALSHVSFFSSECEATLTHLTMTFAGF
jgi:hypothetical protein